MRHRELLACVILPFLGWGSAAAAESGKVGINPPSPQADATSLQVERSERPNIIYILLDDAGFSDLGSFGSEINTPNLDRLAANGLRYNAFHTRAICSPSRAALLTGRNSHSVGMGNLTHVITGAPGKQGQISNSAATVAEILHASGYITFAAGKWHLAPQGKPGPERAQWPIQRGFDQYYGFIGGMTDQFHPELVADNTPISPPDTSGYHFTADIVNRSIGFIQAAEAHDPKQPFFLYFAPGAMHAPHQAPPAYIDKYKAVYAKGWDRVRAERFARQKKLGLIPGNTKLPPRNSDVKPWSSLSEDEKKVATRFQATYAGFLEHTDAEIGRLLAFLDHAKLSANTLIVVMSDNGASPEGEEHGTTNLTFSVANLTKASQPISELAAHVDEFGSDRTYGNYPRGWAMVSNTPFRRYKQSVDEGGLRTPLIVSWPKTITQKGAVRPQFVDIIDITPTVLDVSKATVPDIYRGIPQSPIEGKSIAATFTHPDAPAPRATQYFELQGQRAIWSDGWKAVASHVRGTPFETDTWALYNQKDDFSASRDLSRKHPAILANLQQLWMEEARKYKVLPLEDVTVHSPQFFGEKNGREYKYYSPVRLSYDESPKFTNSSFGVRAIVDRKNPKDEGVVLAYGDRFGGYAIFVKNNRLQLDFNDFGHHSILTSNIEVPVGRSTLSYEFKKTDDFVGVGTLHIDGKAAGNLNLKMTPALAITFAGTDIGSDAGSPVSDAYAGEGAFAFPEGQIEEVTVKIK